MHESQQLEEQQATLVHLEQHCTVTPDAQQISDTETAVCGANSVHARLGNVVKRDHTRRALVIGTLPLLPFAALGAIKALLPEDAWIRLCTNPLFVASSISACVAVPLWTLKPSIRARKATGELAKVDDLSAIGSMVETLYYGTETNTTDQVKDTLIRLHPRVRASDADLLSSRQMVLLQSMLASKTLLRASSSGAADTSILVRAVDNSPNVPFDEMLRPSTGLLSDTIELA